MESQTMPEFIMDGKEEPAFRALDEFTQAYIEAMFWTDEEPGTVQKADDDSENQWDPENQNSLPGDVGFYDLAPETLEKIIADCKAFQETNEALLEEAYELAADGLAYTPERAGHDFWLTRNGHGCGFWSRSFEGHSDIGDRLTARCGWRARKEPGCEGFGEVSTYLGDDGRVYMMAG
jgi:hypothetical protein